MADKLTGLLVSVVNVPDIICPFIRAGIANTATTGLMQSLKPIYS